MSIGDNFQNFPKKGHFGDQKIAWPKILPNRSVERKVMHLVQSQPNKSDKVKCHLFSPKLDTSYPHISRQGYFGGRTIALLFIIPKGH